MLATAFASLEQLVWDVVDAEGQCLFVPPYEVVGEEVEKETLVADVRRLY